MGLSWTSKWTFTSELAQGVMMEALGELADRRPGGSPSSELNGTAAEQLLADHRPGGSPSSELNGTPAEQLEGALARDEAELLERGWAPAVPVDRNLRISIFNAVSEPMLISEFEAKLVDVNIPATGTASVSRDLGLQEGTSLLTAWRSHLDDIKRDAEAVDETHQGFWELAEEAGLQSSDSLRRDVAWAMRIEGEARAAGWPTQWDPRLRKLWLRLGGADESARAWADAGWDFRYLVLSPRLSRYWNMPIPGRLVAIEVPSVQTLDVPPAGVQAWPDVDLTIGTVVEAFNGLLA